VKFSFRQIFASAGGAVLAAVIASFFGVKGTIVGVAIGSAAATFGTAFVAQSIDRGHKAVQQVVVRVPDTSHLLRRLGGTGAAGVTTTETTTAARQSEETTPTEVVVPFATELPTEVVAALMAESSTEVATPLAAEPQTEVIMTSEAALAPVQRRGVRWPIIAGTVAIVFVVSLVFVTAVELVAGRPLADLFGGHVKGDSPSIVRVFKTSPPGTTPTTSTTSTSTTTTSTSTTTTSTTTTIPGDTTSTTDNGSGTSTTTTTGGDSTTTTTTTSPS
jgi:hypothetical protein